METGVHKLQFNDLGSEVSPLNILKSRALKWIWRQCSVIDFTQDNCAASVVTRHWHKFQPSLHCCCPQYLHSPQINITKWGWQPWWSRHWTGTNDMDWVNASHFLLTANKPQYRIGLLRIRCQSNVAQYFDSKPDPISSFNFLGSAKEAMIHCMSQWFVIRDLKAR